MSEPFALKVVLIYCQDVDFAGGANTHSKSKSTDTSPELTLEYGPIRNVEIGVEKFDVPAVVHMSRNAPIAGTFRTLHGDSADIFHFAQGFKVHRHGGNATLQQACLCSCLQCSTHSWMSSFWDV